MTTPATPVPAAAPPGKTLGIVGLILSIFFGIIGTIVSAVALSQSKKAGLKNGPAVAGIIIGIVLTVLWIIIAIVSAVAATSLFGGLAQVCADLGPGIHEVGGVTYTCG